MTTTISTEQMLRDSCGSILETIEGLDDYDAFDDFLEDVLDVTVSGTGAVRDGWTVQSVDLLLTIGGPNITAKVYPDSHTVEVLGYWGADSIRLFGTAGDALTEFARDYAEQMEGV